MARRCWGYRLFCFCELIYDLTRQLLLAMGAALTAATLMQGSTSFTVGLAWTMAVTFVVLVVSVIGIGTIGTRLDGEMESGLMDLLKKDQR